MKKIIGKVTMLAIVFLMAGCNADEVVNKMDDDNQSVNTKTFTVEATIPGDDTSLKGSQTRIGLEKDADAVKLTWKPGDVIELCLVQGEKISEIQAVHLTVADIVEDGKKARFGFDLPQDFNMEENATFTLYGVHGGGGLEVADNSPIAIFPENNGRMSLQDVENDVMLYFSQGDISVANPTVSVNFNHLGSIYNITVENKSESEFNLNEGIKLVPVASTEGWVYTSGGFNLASETITGTPTSEIVFNTSGTVVPVKGAATLYKWIPILSANADWPELKLEFNGNGSWDSKPARTATAGKNYILTAQWNGEQLNFGKYGYKEMDKSNWEVVFANNQTRWSEPDYFATALIDGNIETAWGVLWDGALPGEDEDDYDYGSVDYWGYHMFWKRRDIPNMVIVVDLGRETYIGGVGIGQGPLSIGDRDLKSCEIYVSDSFTFTGDGDLENYNTTNKGNDWILALTCTNIPNEGGGPYWYDVSDANIAAGVSKGRYLKIRPTESHRDNNLASFSELYVKEIVTVDGVPLE